MHTATDSLRACAIPQPTRLRRIESMPAYMACRRYLMAIEFSCMHTVSRRFICAVPTLQPKRWYPSLREHHARVVSEPTLARKLTIVAELYLLCLLLSVQSVVSQLFIVHGVRPSGIRGAFANR